MEMNTLDKSKFLQLISTKALLCSPKVAGLGLQKFKKSDFLFSIRAYPSIIKTLKDPSKRLLLLNHLNDKVPSEIAEFAMENKAEVVDHELSLDYTYFSVEEVLKKVFNKGPVDCLLGLINDSEIEERDFSHRDRPKLIPQILPPTVAVPSSFATTGHLAHLNLRADHEPWKFIIGQVILDKNGPAIKTVVNKVGEIDSVYRTFEMEVLAGEDNTMVAVREGDCSFLFDFRKVYWNSRLQVEHRRLISLFKPDEAICDVFGGIGPFALPAGKKGCIVFANDLNPASFEYLAENIKRNKVGHKVIPFCMDGSEFIKRSLSLLREEKYWESFKKAAHFAVKRQKAEREIPKDNNRLTKFDHYIMNLPATATSFLVTFKGLFYGPGCEEGKTIMPMIHCYSFSKEKDSSADTIKKTEAIVGAIDKDSLNIHKVRNVSVGTEMVCISFRLPTKFAFAAPSVADKKRKAID